MLNILWFNSQNRQQIPSNYFLVYSLTENRFIEMYASYGGQKPTKISRLTNSITSSNQKKNEAFLSVLVMNHATNSRWSYQKHTNFGFSTTAAQKHQNSIMGSKTVFRSLKKSHCSNCPLSLKSVTRGSQTVFASRKH